MHETYNPGCVYYNTSELVMHLFIRRKIQAVFRTILSSSICIGMSIKFMFIIKQWARNELAVNPGFVYYNAGEIEMHWIANQTCVFYNTSEVILY